MPVTIRAADLVRDRRLLIDTLRRYLSPLSNDARFEWLYCANPHGPARTWIATDTDTQTVVGVASAFPRRVYVDGAEQTSWVLGDFCISDRYRSLGPALQLQRACLAEVDTGTVTFCSDFPSTRMMAIYRRLQVCPIGQMVRLAKPLRIDRRVQQLCKTATVARGLSAAGNILLALCDWKPSVGSELTFSLYKGECGEEFSVLAQRVGSRYGICAQRSAEYLNWRYRANPLCQYELMTAHKGEVLTAYVVFTHTDEDAILVDLFGDEDQTAIPLLVYSVVKLLRSRGVVTVSAPLFESHPWCSLLQQRGFRIREAGPVVVYRSPQCSWKESSLREMNLFLTHGDRDS